MCLHTQQQKCAPVAEIPTTSAMYLTQAQSTMRSPVPDVVAALVYTGFLAVLLHQGLWSDIQPVLASSNPLPSVRFVKCDCWCVSCCMCVLLVYTRSFPSQVEAFASLFTKPRIVLLAWLHLLTLDLYQAKYGALLLNVVVFDCDHTPCVYSPSYTHTLFSERCFWMAYATACGPCIQLYCALCLGHWAC